MSGSPVSGESVTRDDGKPVFRDRPAGRVCWKSSMIVRSRRSSVGTATTCVVAPQSMPAASGLMRSNTEGDVRRGRRGRRGRDSAIGHLQWVEASGHREHENDQTPKRDHHRSGVTNDQNVTPRTTLLDGHDSRTSVAHGLGARMRPPSYVRSSPDARITTGFSADEPWQRHMYRYSLLTTELVSTFSPECNGEQSERRVAS